LPAADRKPRSANWSATLRNDTGRRFGSGRSNCRARAIDAHAALDQYQNAQFLSDEIAGEAAGVFDQDDLDTVILDAIEQRSETGARLDRIGPW
jgi:hypothetical protein